MNRENTGAKPTAPPRLPPEAEQEILEALFEGMEIHSRNNRIPLSRRRWRPSKTATASAWASGSWPVSETRAASVKCWPTEKAAM